MKVDMPLNKETEKYVRLVVTVILLSTNASADIKSEKKATEFISHTTCSINKPLCKTLFNPINVNAFIYLKNCLKLKFLFYQ